MAYPSTLQNNSKYKSSGRSSPSGHSRIQVNLPSGKTRFETTHIVDSRRTAYFGERVNLFQGVVDINTEAIKTYSLSVQNAIVKEMTKLAREGRDMARSRAPSRTGALRAGIYMTSAPTQAQLKANADGQEIKQAKLKAHGSGYYKSIVSAAKRRGIQVPGLNDNGDQKEGISAELVREKTQRALGGSKKDGIAPQSLESFKSSLLNGEGKYSYQELNNTLPFNPLPNVGMETFFIGIGSAMYYSAWIEYGTSRMRARPFFTQAAMYMTAQAPKRLANAIRNTKVTPSAIRGSKR